MGTVHVPVFAAARPRRHSRASQEAVLYKVNIKDHTLVAPCDGIICRTLSIWNGPATCQPIQRRTTKVSPGRRASISRLSIRRSSLVIAVGSMPVQTNIAAFEVGTALEYNSFRARSTGGFTPCPLYTENRHQRAPPLYPLCALS